MPGNEAISAVLCFLFYQTLKICVGKSQDNKICRFSLCHIDRANWLFFVESPRGRLKDKRRLKERER